MFGKGIYFADMVSKSANYCVASKSNPVGLMLLCDVALGKWYARRGIFRIRRLMLSLFFFSPATSAKKRITSRSSRKSTRACAASARLGRILRDPR